MSGYPEEVVQKVWEKGRAVDFASPDEWRLDHRGAWICRRSYGDPNSPFGWHIERAEGNGCDLLCNLRPGSLRRAVASDLARSLAVAGELAKRGPHGAGEGT